MRFLFAFCFLALLSMPPVARAAEDSAQSPVPAAYDNASRLDQLFGELKRERNEKAAERIAGRIWHAWLNSGSATADLLVQWAIEATKEKKFNVALDFLDQVVTKYPDYAEGWNRRATVHFMMNNYSESMTDIARTLELEPRHFGALTGMANILEATGRKEGALQAYQRVLEIYPMMRSAQGSVTKLSDDLAGEGI
ncbi:tetratricopeptide repeat protein [Mesorhizobium sp. J18]|uniref:tetratricopeptide repeat protein n=1 Tax=Mesorhizobium sp. J18 TaxID=935263 RepID=UPI00119D3289|nr:tetratricopeptide repeat protein [Mesorhizobium sp. J18]